MLVNAASITGVFVNLKTIFNKAFENTPEVWSKIATKVPSTGRSNEYSWVDHFPAMREWIDEKHIQRLAAHVFTIVNKAFEATVGVKRDDIEDDQLGLYGPMAQNAGFAAKTWPDELVMGLVNKVFTEVCWDKQYMCDTDHPLEDGTTYSNKGTAVLSVATQAAAAASYGAARTAIRKMKTYQGKVLNLVPNLLLVPPALEDTANALMKNDRLDDGKANPYKGTAEVVVDGRLTSDTAWFLLVTNRPIKPFIFQERKKPVFVQQTSMENDDVFEKGEFKFGAESRGNAGFGMPQQIYGSTGTG